MNFNKTSLSLALTTIATAAAVLSSTATNAILIKGSFSNSSDVARYRNLATSLNPTIKQSTGYLVAVTPDKQKYLNCGGTIIHEYWLVTAAHCVANVGNIGGYLVNEYSRVGVDLVVVDRDHYNSPTLSKGYYDPVTKTNFLNDAPNDIALVHLAESASSKGFKVAKYATTPDQAPTTFNGLLTGYGTRGDGRTYEMTDKEKNEDEKAKPKEKKTLEDIVKDRVGKNPKLSSAPSIKLLLNSGGLISLGTLSKAGSTDRLAANNRIYSIRSDKSLYAADFDSGQFNDDIDSVSGLDLEGAASPGDSGSGVFDSSNRLQALNVGVGYGKKVKTVLGEKPTEYLSYPGTYGSLNFFVGIGAKAKWINTVLSSDLKPSTIKTSPVLKDGKYLAKLLPPGVLTAPNY